MYFHQPMSMNPIPGPIGSDHPKKSDRNPGCGTTNGSDGKIIITLHLITIHLISTMGCNFTQLSDPIGSECRIRSDSTLWIQSRNQFVSS
jgi:hypothetical protein